VHKLRFLNFSVDRGNGVESYPQLINMSFSSEILVNQGILESGPCVMNMCTGHNTNTTNFLKEEKEKGEK